MPRLRVQKTTRTYNLAVDALLIVMALGILSVLWMLSQHPFAAQIEARNAKRSSDVQRILEAVAAYDVARPSSPLPIPYRTSCGLDPSQEICRGSAACKQGVDLTALVSGGYLPSLPIDPLANAQEATGYSAIRTATGGTVICAPRAENRVNIEVGG